jgi:Fe-Mn family superoxide dismutase
LPFAYDALEPHIGARTVEIHYTKHHQGYVDKLNAEVGGDRSLIDIVRNSKGDLYNNAAQVWNHNFYWCSIEPNGGGRPKDPTTEELRKHFGSVDAFKREFGEAAKGEFGSGWAWLVRDRKGALKILSSTDAENPLRANETPVLTIDVWEHAYYLDYANERGKYVEAFLDHLLNWDFLEENL